DDESRTPSLWSRLFLPVVIVSVAQLPLQAAPAPPVKYIFIPHTNRQLMIEGRMLMQFGKVDAEGNFHLERTLPATAISSIAPDVGINCFQPVRVYEYRSRRLVPGTLVPDGKFIPDANPKVIMFEEYRYGPGAVRIWH